MELLVVVSIIALLLGILLPALSGAREVAKQTTCAAQIRQMGLALESFANERNNWYPMAGAHIVWDAIDPVTKRKSWMQQLADSQLQGHKDIFSDCPSYPEESDYHFFLGARAAYLDKGGFAPLFRNRLKFPVAYVLSGDLNRKFDVEDADKDDYTQSCVELDNHTTGPYWQPHHNDGLNILFADGHVAHHTRFDASAMTYRYRKMEAWE